MKLTDYICQFLEKITDSIFLVSGGGCMYMVDSIGKSKLKSYCCHHEQAATLAAEGYARMKNDVGVASVTTGPGGTNAVTGVAAAWVDCIPLMVFSGQVREEIRLTEEDKKEGLRQIGPQEINIIDIVKPITKYAVMVTNPNKIRYELEKVYYIAKSGCPGPVWLDIPLDVQRAEIDENSLEGFEKLEEQPEEQKEEIPYYKIVNALNKAKRPLMLIGHGIRLGGGVEKLWKFIEKTKINVISAMSGDDLVNSYEYYLGAQGITGVETANYAIDNCDLLLIVGTRMQIRQTSFEYKNFAKNAIKIMVDINKAELKKRTVDIDIPVCADAKEFLEGLLNKNINLKRWNIPIKPIEPFESKKGYIDVYEFLKELSGKCDFPVITSNGMTAEIPHQVLKLKRGQRLITNTAFGEMGKGLPMAIGACIANNKKPVICMEGDGSIMMNIQELQTLVYHKLPIKIFLFNNGGYYSIRNTMAHYFNKVFAADKNSGVGFPCFEKLVTGWGIKYEFIKSKEDLYKIKEILAYPEAVFCELFIDPAQKMIPRWSAKK